MNFTSAALEIFDRPQAQPMQQLFKMQLFHPAFRHLWYLSGIAMLGLMVLGYAYEKLSGNTSGVAILGFSASIVHASAWWFTIGVISPLKKIIACGILFVGAMASAFLGRFAYFVVADQPIETLLENMKFIALVIPAWWLCLAITDGVVKETMRVRLNFAGTPVSPRISLTDLFQLTAIVGAVLAFSRSTAISLIGTDYASILVVSVAVNVVLMIPLSLLVLNSMMQKPTWRFLKFMAGLVLAIFGMFALSHAVSQTMESISDVAVGVITLMVPYCLMLLMARDNQLSLTSGWWHRDL